MKLVKGTDKLQEKNQNISDQKAEEAIEILIRWIGEDPEREGLKSTPKRVVRAYKEYFQGYKEDPAKHLTKTFTEIEDYDDMIIEKDISIRSHCEHHMAPIIGVAHIAYIPSKKVVGLSKLARVVEAFSKRLQTQERLTMQIAKTIMHVLQPRGVAVTIDAMHQCMTSRGIKKEKTTTVTNYFLGAFKEDLSFQNRYLRYINKN
jgi:GTP cyclohydrolase I